MVQDLLSLYLPPRNDNVTPDFFNQTGCVAMIVFSTHRRFLLPIICWTLALSGSLSLYGQLAFNPASVGINRAFLYSFEEIPNGILAGTGNGVWHFSAGTQQWVKTTLGRETYIVKRLPSGTLLAGTNGDIYRSTDNGGSWSAQFNVPDVGSFGVMADGTIIGVSRTSTLGGQQHYYYQSSDDGKSWQRVPIQFGIGAGTNVVGLGNYLFSGSINGVKISYNKGQLWETTNLTLPVTGLISTSNGVLVAAAGNEYAQKYLYESTDTGRTWRLADSIPVDIGPDFNQDKGSIAGLSRGKSGGYYVSVEGSTGQEWEGIWRREPGKAGWKRIAPLSGVMNFDMANPWISSGLRALSSTDNGTSWTENGKGLRNFSAPNIIFDAEGRSYALVPERQHTYWPGSPLLNHSLFRLSPGSSLWEEIEGGFSGDVLRIDAFGNIYVTRGQLLPFTDDQGEMQEWGGNVTMISRDRGETWNEIGIGRLVQLRTESTGKIVIRVIATRDGESDLFYSDDSGATWKSMIASAPGEKQKISSSSAALPLPDGSILFAITLDNPETAEDDKGLYRIRQDYSVEKVSEGILADDLYRLADGTLFASGWGREKETDPPHETLGELGVYRSTDNGVTWEEMTSSRRTNFFTDLGRGTIICSPALSLDSGRTWSLPSLYVDRSLKTIKGDLYGHNPGGPMLTLGSSSQWSPVTVAGLPSGVISSAASPLSELVIVSSTSDGIYSTAAGSSSVLYEEHARYEGIHLEVRIAADYDMAQISFVLSQGGETEVSLYDLSGKKRAEIAKGFRNAGTHHLLASLADLPRGNYLLLVRTESGQSARIFSRL